MDWRWRCQEEVPITIVLCNNGGYGAIAANMRATHGHADLGCALTNPNFLKFADAYGITGTRVDNLSDFRRALEQHVGSNRPISWS